MDFKEVFETVTEQKTAKLVGSGDLAVYATPAMAALMERAAMELAAPLLEKGETTVGCELNIKHLAATPVGATVCAKAILKHRDGKMICFALEAYCGDKKIGEGEHVRAVVNSDKFMQRLSGN